MTRTVSALFSICCLSAHTCRPSSCGLLILNRQGDMGGRIGTQCVKSTPTRHGGLPLQQCKGARGTAVGAHTPQALGHAPRGDIYTAAVEPPLAALTAHHKPGRRLAAHAVQRRILVFPAARRACGCPCCRAPAHRPARGARPDVLALLMQVTAARCQRTVPFIGHAVKDCLVCLVMKRNTRLQICCAPVRVGRLSKAQTIHFVIQPFAAAAELRAAGIVTGVRLIFQCGIRCILIGRRQCKDN